MVALKRPVEDPENMFTFWRTIAETNMTKILNLTEYRNNYYPTENRPELRFRSNDGEMTVKLNSE